MCLVIPLALFLYFLGGFLFLKVVKKTEGVVEAIPNKDFWVSIPGLVVDGTRFIR